MSDATAAPSPALPPGAVLVHAMPGRLRLRLPTLRGDTAGLSRLHQRLAQQEGVRGVRSDPRTGSLVVQGEMDAGRLARWGEGERLFRLAAPSLPIPSGGQPAVPHPVAQDVGDWMDRMDDRLKRATGGLLGLAGSAAFLLLTFAAIQAVRGRVGPPAVTLLWYAATAALLAQSDRRHRFS